MSAATAVSGVVLALTKIAGTMLGANSHRQIVENATILAGFSCRVSALRLESALRYTAREFMADLITRRPFTVDDCYRMVQAGILHEDERVELIRGDLIKMSPIGPRHQAAVDRSNRAFVRCAGESAIVRVQGTTVLDQFSAPEPDLLLLSPRDDFYAQKHPGPQDVLLLLEVADSSLEYDTTVKTALYAIMGIREYWIADLRNNLVVCQTEPIQGKDLYRNVRVFHQADILSPGLIPDCSLSAGVLLP